MRISKLTMVNNLVGTDGNKECLGGNEPDQTHLAHLLSTCKYLASYGANLSLVNI